MKILQFYFSSKVNYLQQHLIIALKLVKAKKKIKHLRKSNFLGNTRKLKLLFLLKKKTNLIFKF